MARRLALSLTAEDDWASIAELNDTPAIQAWLIEGFIGALSNAAELLFSNSRPADADSGVSLQANGTAGVGPVARVEAGYPLQEIWVKNATGGADATVVVSGVVE